jgi:L,D-peptidoglycan transpeptidase YkuD (ErfK/YbiS/YcfS/YnhG family)
MNCLPPRSFARNRERNVAGTGPVLITVRQAPGRPGRGILALGAMALPCALGRSGIRALKREGDGATPMAHLRLICGFYRPGGGRWPATALAMRPIGPADGWCDAPTDRNYNRPVRLPYPASHERMARTDGLYDICIALDWNLSSRGRGRGSAIFLHLARPGYPPTAGCIALSRRDMARILPRLSRRTIIRVVG